MKKTTLLHRTWVGVSFRKVLFVAMLLAFTSSFAQSTAPLNEKFNNSSWPLGWTKATPLGSVDWIIDYTYNQAHSGYIVLLWIMTVNMIVG